MDGRAPELDRPNERTALLGQHNGNGADGLTGTAELPAIKPAAALVHAQGVRFTSHDDLTSHELSTRSAQTAFTLVVLLYVLYKSEPKPEKDVWETWLQEQMHSEDVHTLEQQVMQVWDAFLHADGSGKDVEDVLWMAFPLEAGEMPSIRVIDFLVENCAPDSLLSHRIVYLSLAQAWKCGRLRVGEPNVPLSRRLSRRFDSLATPRVLHLIELVIKLLYLFLLANYVVTPPRKPVIVDSPSSIGFRGACLLIYSTSILLRRWSAATFPSLLVFLAFIFHITAEPCPGDFAFDLLLFALIWHLVALHLPGPPSPLLLFRIIDSLPLSMLLHGAVTQAIRPIILLFLPISLLSLYMLSLSLSDAFLRMITTSTDPLPAAPMETRTAFLMLCFVILVLFVSSLCILIMITASQGFRSIRRTESWDRFGVEIGKQARQSFYSTIHHYSGPYYFPPPYNLLYLVSVQIPTIIVGLFKRELARRISSTLEELLWRTTVGPLVFAFGGLWLWGLRSS